MELLADFQQFYGLKVDKVIDSDPERVEWLIKGLLHRSDSLYRAQYLRENPTRKGRATRVLDWYEWGPTLAILVQILNTLTMQSGGRSAAQHTLKPPSERMVVKAGDVMGVERAMGAMG